MKTLLLYTTEGCHLCEQAECQLELLHKQGVASWKKVEISESYDLIEQYGVRIPVIRDGQHRELGWPFGLEQLRQWVNEGLTVES